MPCMYLCRVDSTFAQQFNALSLEHECVTWLESNGYADPFGRFQRMLAAGGKRKAEVWQADASQWDAFCTFTETSPETIKPMLLSYGLKDLFEGLHSAHPETGGFPLAGCFIPEVLTLETRNDKVLQTERADEKLQPKRLETSHIPALKVHTSREAYRAVFERIQQQLKRGNIYETNYCIHFSAHVPQLDPVELFEKLNARAPAPFAALIKWNQSWLICGSPERYLLRQGPRLISQPIKGTARRTGDPETDAETQIRLRNDPKERAENIMITDLVRNDLSALALPGSVMVDELCGIYPYNRVFQMISTVSAELEAGSRNKPVWEHSFPMGSMTGVPKRKAMEIMDELEGFNRGLYSGSVGYIGNPDTFDLNVVIRSFIWNAQSGLLSYSTGGAITIRSDADQEYDECLLKAESLLQTLHSLH